MEEDLLRKKGSLYVSRVGGNFHLSGIALLKSNVSRDSLQGEALIGNDSVHRQISRVSLADKGLAPQIGKTGFSRTHMNRDLSRYGDRDRRNIPRSGGK